MNTRHFSQLPKPYLAYPKVIQGLIGFVAQRFEMQSAPN